MNLKKFFYQQTCFLTSFTLFVTSFILPQRTVFAKSQEESLSAFNKKAETLGEFLLGSKVYTFGKKEDAPQSPSSNPYENLGFEEFLKNGGPNFDLREISTLTPTKNEDWGYLEIISRKLIEGDKENVSFFNSLENDVKRMYQKNNYFYTNNYFYSEEDIKTIEGNYAKGEELKFFLETYLRNSEISQEDKNALILNYVKFVVIPLRAHYRMAQHYHRFDKNAEDFKGTFPALNLNKIDSLLYFQGDFDEYEVNEALSQEGLGIHLIRNNKGFKIKFNLFETISKDISMLLALPTLKNYAQALKLINITRYIQKYYIDHLLSRSSEDLRDESNLVLPLPKSCSSFQNGNIPTQLSSYDFQETLHKESPPSLFQYDFLTKMTKIHHDKKNLQYSDPLYGDFFDSTYDEKSIPGPFSDSFTKKSQSPFYFDNYLSYKRALIDLSNKDSLWGLVQDKSVDDILPHFDDSLYFNNIINLKMSEIESIFIRNYHYRHKNLKNKIKKIAHKSYELFQSLTDFKDSGKNSFLEKLEAEFEIKDAFKLLSASNIDMLKRQKIAVPFPRYYGDVRKLQISLSLLANLFQENIDSPPSGPLNQIIQNSCDSVSLEESQNICSSDNIIESLANHLSIYLNSPENYQEDNSISAQINVPYRVLQKNHIKKIYPLLKTIWNTLSLNNNNIFKEIIDSNHTFKNSIKTNEYDLLYLKYNQGKKDSWAVLRLSYLLSIQEKFEKHSNIKGVKKEEEIFKSASSILKINTPLAINNIDRILTEEEKIEMLKSALSPYEKKSNHLFTLPVSLNEKDQGQNILGDIFETNVLSSEGKSYLKSKWPHYIGEESFKLNSEERKLYRTVDGEFLGNSGNIDFGVNAIMSPNFDYAEPIIEKQIEIDEKLKEMYSYYESNDLENFTKSYKSFIENYDPNKTINNYSLKLFSRIESDAKVPIYLSVIRKMAISSKHASYENIEKYCNLNLHDEEDYKLIIKSTTQDVIKETGNPIPNYVTEKSNEMSEGELNATKLSLVGLMLPIFATIGGMALCTNPATCPVFLAYLIGASTIFIGYTQGYLIFEELHEKSIADDNVKYLEDLKKMGFGDEENIDNVSRSWFFPAFEIVTATTILKIFSMGLKKSYSMIYAGAKFRKLNKSTKNVAKKLYKEEKKLAISTSAFKIDAHQDLKILNLLPNDFSSEEIKLSKKFFKDVESVLDRHGKNLITDEEASKLLSNIYIKKRADLNNIVHTFYHERNPFDEIVKNLTIEEINKNTVNAIVEIYNKNPERFLKYLNSYLKKVEKALRLQSKNNLGTYEKMNLFILKDAAEQADKFKKIRNELESFLEYQNHNIHKEIVLANGETVTISSFEDYLKYHIDDLTDVFVKIPMQKREFIYAMLLQGGRFLSPKQIKYAAKFTGKLFPNTIILRRYFTARSRLIADKIYYQASKSLELTPSSFRLTNKTSQILTAFHRKIIEKSIQSPIALEEEIRFLNLFEKKMASKFSKLLKSDTSDRFLKTLEQVFPNETFIRSSNELIAFEKNIFSKKDLREILFYPSSANEKHLSHLLWEKLNSKTTFETFFKKEGNDTRNISTIIMEILKSRSNYSLREYINNTEILLLNKEINMVEII